MENNTSSVSSIYGDILDMCQIPQDSPAPISPKFILPRDVRVRIRFKYLNFFIYLILSKYKYLFSYSMEKFHLIILIGTQILSTKEHKSLYRLLSTPSNKTLYHKVCGIKFMSAYLGSLITDIKRDFVRDVKRQNPEFAHISHTDMFFAICDNIIAELDNGMDAKYVSLSPDMLYYPKNPTPEQTARLAALIPTNGMLYHSSHLFNAYASDVPVDKILQELNICYIPEEYTAIEYLQLILTDEEKEIYGVM